MSKQSRATTTSPMTDRRAFLKTATTATAGLATMSFAAPGIAKSKSPNERLGVAVIGAGGRAGGHMSVLNDLMKRDKYPIDLVAVCDVYRPRLEARQKQFKFAKAYTDHRELLADPAVDVVHIATPDHVHGYQAIDAIQAGKDVYCEKPVTHWTQFDLTKELTEVVANSNQVFQLGTQGMSDSAWHQMKALVKEGRIGKPLHGEAGFFRVGDWGERRMPVDDPNAKPGKDLDWDAFLGTAPKRPFDVDRFFRWRLFEDYAGGPATDLYPHCLTQVVDILGVGFPDTVVASGGIMRYVYELREVPDTINLIAKYPEKVTISVLGTQANDFNGEESRGAGQRQPMIRGWEGSLSITNHNEDILFTPVNEGGNPGKPERIKIERAENMKDYFKNFLDGCLNRDKNTWSPMDLAFRTQTVLQMAMLGMRGEKVARFDQEKKTIIA